MCYYDINYGEYDHFKELLINKRIVEWNEDSLILEDGTEITMPQTLVTIKIFYHE